MNKAVEKLIAKIEYQRSAVEINWPRRFCGKYPQKISQVLHSGHSLVRSTCGEIDSFHKITTTVPSVPSEERKQEIVDGLVSLSRRGLLGGVWWGKGEGEPLKIRYVLIGEPEFITWTDAAELADNASRAPGDRSIGPVLIRHAWRA